MPELPEVETVCEQIRPGLVASSVTETGSHPSEKFTPANELLGATFESVSRRGKFIIVATDDDREFIVHLGMTGRIAFDSKLDEGDPYLRAWLKLSQTRSSQTRDTYFHFYDVRRFGRLRVVTAGDYSNIPTLKQMGPEPFDDEFTPTQLHSALKKSRRSIKTQLLSQKPVAGVGNIYADEALWMAKISPRRTSVSAKRCVDLHAAIKTALQRGIDNGGTTLRDYRDAYGEKGNNQRQLEVYGRGGEECYRCGSELVSAQIDARTTTWCKTCQT